MATYNVSGAYGDATVVGTGPFKLGQDGGVNGAVFVANADGSQAKVSIAPETGNTVFADTASGLDVVNAIIDDLNDAIDAEGGDEGGDEGGE